MTAMRGFVAFCCMLVLGAGLAFAQPTLSPREFRDRAIAQLLKTAPDAQIQTRGDLGITVDVPSIPGRQGMQINFDNAYEAYLQDPTQLEPLLRRWTSLATADTNDVFQRDRLIAVVRPYAQIVAYNEQLRQLPGEAPTQLISRPFAGDLHEVLVFDSAEAVAYATADRLTALNISEEEAWRLSRDNIPVRMGSVVVEQYDGGVLLMSGGNGLAPSTLLMPDFCQGMFGRNRVLVVDREALIMADANVRGSDAAFRAVTRGIIASHDTISVTVLFCQNGHIVAESD